MTMTTDELADALDDGQHDADCRLTRTKCYRKCNCSLPARQQAATRLRELQAEVVRLSDPLACDTYGGGHHSDGCRACAVKSLKAEVTRLREALQTIRTHHVEINTRVGRAIERSKTIRVCDEALTGLDAVTGEKR